MAAMTGFSRKSREGPIGPSPSAGTLSYFPSANAFRSAPAQKLPPSPQSHVRLGVGLEVAKCAGERARGLRVHRVPRLRPAEDDRGDRALFLDAHAHPRELRPQSRIGPPPAGEARRWGELKETLRHINPPTLHHRHSADAVCQSWHRELRMASANRPKNL